MEAGRHQVVNLSDKRRPDPTRTDELSMADIKESLRRVLAQSELISKQNLKILHLLELPNKKTNETTTIPTIKVPEAVAQPKTDSLSGPVQFFLKLIELWRLDSEDACKLLGYEPAEIQLDQVLSGRLPFSRDLKDRIVNLLVIRKRLSGLFRDTDAEIEWLREKHVELGNKSPIELLLSGSMENLLLIKEFVEHVGGF
jgi:uncharacterized protein (DUF2384 family)